MRLPIKIELLLFFCLLGLNSSFAQRLHCLKGLLWFTSDAPLESIKATTKTINAVVDLAKNEFALSVPVKSFVGFNSPLQMEHFNENYMESNRFPLATFSGKIIERIDVEHDLKGTFRAKGILDVHGVKQERIIKCTISANDKVYMVKSDFDILLEDHQVSIPRIVHQKIAEKIMIHIEMTLAVR